MDKVGIGLLGLRHRRVRRGQAAQEERRGHHAGDRQAGRTSGACSRRTRASAHPDLDPALLTTRFEDILEDPEIEIVVELIGGTGAALDFQLRALKAGKNVVTANKQLLAQHGAELFAAAEESGVHLRFEASAVGAVPVIKVLRESLVAAEVKTVFGIVNGTTNYMLSAMAETGADYDDVLKEAQRLGYAEADPTEDVGGKDAAAKMAILSSIAFHSRTRPRRRALRGHHQASRPPTSPTAGASASSPSCSASPSSSTARMNVRVYPAFLPRTHPLAGVTGAYNAVFLESDAFDEIMLFGPGAGSVPDGLRRHRRHHLGGQHGEGQLRAELPVLQGRAVLPRRRHGVEVLPAG